MAKMYTQRETSVTSQPLRGKRPTRNKRSHAESEDSEQEQGQSKKRSSGKPLKLRVNMFQKYFLHPKADGSQRLILNLKKFNESVVYKHFKMDSIQTITKLIEKDCYIAALDLKDAYYSIPVRKHDQQFLQFEWNSTRY